MTERVGSNIVEVDPDQDLTDLVYRLREIPGESALVIPPGAPRFQDDDSFRVLKRHAISTGRTVAVITADADIQASARAAGLPAFADRAAYEARAVPAPPAPPRPRPVHVAAGARPDRRVLLAAAAGLAFIALAAAAIFLPSATVTLSVSGSPVKADASLVGSPGNYNAGFLTFNTRPIEATSVDSQGAPLTGQRVIPAVAASGEVVFTATTTCGPPISLVAGTIVETADHKQYATRDAVTLCLTGSSAITTVSAVVAGSAGNVPAYSLKTVDGQSGVSVTNPAPLGGGAETRTAIVVQQSDVDALRRQVIARTDAAVHTQLKTMAGDWHVIASPYPQISSEINPPVGSEATSVSVTVTEVLKAVAFSDRDVHARLRDAIKVRVPPDYALTGDPIKTWYEVVEANEDGHVVLNGHGQAYAMPVLNARALARTVAGHTLGSARDQLRKLPAVVRVDFRQQPVALPWLPLQASHVSIEVFESALGST